MASPRFNDYREVVARFATVGTRCHHEIRPGDRIGYAPRSKHWICADCWRAWAHENAEAAYWEI